MDATALQRQKRRIERLKSQGISRTTVFVHDGCKASLDALRGLLINPINADLIEEILAQVQSKKSPTNIAKVRHLSPFRYPGGKTWLVPEICSWLLCSKLPPSVFVEPFAGGAIASLTVAKEELSSKVIMSEIDRDVAAVWQVVLLEDEVESNWLCDQIISFNVSIENVKKIIEGNPRSIKRVAFRTIIKNRMQRGGIMAARAGLINAGEGGKGLSSRWYPITLANRIKEIRQYRERIIFKNADAFDTIQEYSDDPNAHFFIDPPYTAGGKNAGMRLYTHSKVDHAELFYVVSRIRGRAMLTYDDSAEIRELAKEYRFKIEETTMKSTHHKIHKELIICNR